MQRAYLALLNRLKSVRVVPKKHVLDNECSDAMKELIRETCELELVPPGCHRCNIAVVAIKAFKQHFLSVLAGVAPDFPRSLWDRLLPQVQITLNLLRQSNATPTISAHAHLFGQFDYNRMPLAPMGCSAEVHVKPDNRKSWDYHTKSAWYLYTLTEHYRVHNLAIKSTKAKRLSDTVVFMHKRITQPPMTHGNLIAK